MRRRTRTKRNRLEDEFSAEYVRQERCRVMADLMNQHLESRAEGRREVIIDDPEEIIDLTSFAQRIEEQVADLMDMTLDELDSMHDEVGPAGHQYLSNANIPPTETAVIKDGLSIWAPSHFIAILLMRGSYHLSKRHYLFIRAIFTFMTFHSRRRSTVFIITGRTLMTEGLSNHRVLSRTAQALPTPPVSRTSNKMVCL